MTAQASTRKSTAATPSQRTAAEGAKTWTWQETLTYEGTESECRAAYEAFAKKKNGAHFVQGVKNPAPIHHSPSALVKLPRKKTESRKKS